MERNYIKKFANQNSQASLKSDWSGQDKTVFEVSTQYHNRRLEAFRVDVRPSKVDSCVKRVRLSTLSKCPLPTPTYIQADVTVVINATRLTCPSD